MAIHVLTVTLATALAGAVVASPETASSVCVYNDAAFVLKYHLENADTGKEGPESGSYPVWQTRCQSLATLAPKAGDTIRPIVKAILGRTITVDSPVLYDAINATQITYICKGTTLDFSCTQGPPPRDGR